MTKILIFGIDGMLGHVMTNYFLLEKQLDIYGISKLENLKETNTNLNSAKIFFSNTLDDEFITNVIYEVKPDFVVNCIGIVKQSKLMNDYIQMIYINSVLPHKLAKICKKFQSKLIHFSTDCIFSGNKGLYKEDDISDAQENYGRSKFLGEVNYGDSITLRTSFFGHQIKSKYSLLEWFLAEKNKCQGYVNHIYSGLPTLEIARIVKEIIFKYPKISGLYHVSNDPINKYDLLKLIKKIYKKNIKIIKNTDTTLNRSLDSSLFREKIGYKPPSWELLIKQMHKFQEEKNV